MPSHNTARAPPAAVFDKAVGIIRESACCRLCRRRHKRHQITNAASESLNAKIQWVKYTARGFRNKQNFINAIYFHCGGLDLDPSPTK